MPQRRWPHLVGFLTFSFSLNSRHPASYSQVTSSFEVLFCFKKCFCEVWQAAVHKTKKFNIHLIQWNELCGSLNPSPNRYALLKQMGSLYCHHIHVFEMVQVLNHCSFYFTFANHKSDLCMEDMGSSMLYKYTSAYHFTICNFLLVAK